MDYAYRPFHLEQWVSQMYQSININKPDDIVESVIADAFRIKLIYSRNKSYSTSDGLFKMININQRLDAFTKREVFFHELGHILLHSGNQHENMPMLFLQLEEWDAINFTQYAAIPYHMFSYIDFYSPSIINNMQSLFKVNRNICMKRIKKIRRNAKIVL